MAEECANPLFLSWVKEWWDQAKERNTKGVIAYRNAHESLRACPIRFEHPDQLLALRGFGAKMCSRLLERLTQHCAANGLPVPPKRRLAADTVSQIAATAPGPSSLARTNSHSINEGVVAGQRPQRTRKAYVPVLRQGGYAILMALSSPEANGRDWLAKPEVIELAQPHCDASFTVAPPGRFYTAWKSIETLLKNDLVAERGRPHKRYALTDEGWEVANKLRAAVLGGAGGAQAALAAQAAHSLPIPDGQPGLSAAELDLVPDGPAVTSAAVLPEIAPVELPAGSFSVRLVLDMRERVTGQRTYMEDELAKKEAKPLVRALSLGDALWVAKCHDASLLSRLGAEGDEVVLDWIVERKRQDDLVSSIKDGRFHEQKFRLRRSGVPHVVYVIEEGGMDADMLMKHEERMQSSIASTQMTNGYFVKTTAKVDDTIAYLARMTRRLQAQYANKPLHVLPTAALTAQNHVPWLRALRSVDRAGSYCVSYAAFASLTSKSETLSLRDVFLKMLMCTRGVTGERALAIQKVWSTPYEFVQAFEELEREIQATDDGLGAVDDTVRKRKREMVFDKLGRLPGTKRRVTKPLSEKLAEVWGGAL
ncbi:crossover junction endonuclease MUS81 [Sporothrix brasiliensis 5110]|uniref:Crossover junction endonuclease MUS81 n=1 Tax=Sporothrix brasiliensis 5110 TaxID=1398154 RepID=A0A0C2IJP5_9PEZI|nr:crossover junction endonuclease MUS81 [Sporothrix brasiliensis 5110]KIH87155.1 crossover junction endonuclease MUS81 [Sporothrix brasiliensis 5110]